MPELPDVVVYLEALRERIAGSVLKRVILRTPFLLRSTTPPLESTHGRRVQEVRRLGKRIAIGLEGDLWLVIHLMIAGRMHWRSSAAKTGSKNVLAVFEFDSGVLVLTEAGSQRRASLHAALGEEGLRALHAGGLEVMDAEMPAFAAALTTENHTLKRALTDPHLFSGIGNAYSDEILHAAKLSPLKLTRSLSDQERARLREATRATLLTWVDRLRKDVNGGFPEKVTAFRDDMAVHGRFKQPCPVCAAPVQRIVYAANECNYCATCQTNGRLLADRSLSRLLKDDWPRSIDDV